MVFVNCKWCHEKKEITNEGVVCDDCVEDYLVDTNYNEKKEDDLVKMLCWV